MKPLNFERAPAILRGLGLAVPGVCGRGGSEGVGKRGGQKEGSWRERCTVLCTGHRAQVGMLLCRAWMPPNRLTGTAQARPGERTRSPDLHMRAGRQRSGAALYSNKAFSTHAVPFHSSGRKGSVWIQVVVVHCTRAVRGWPVELAGLDGLVTC